MPKFSDYTLITKLGKGAFGQAWTARRKGVAELTCLKFCDMSKLPSKAKELQRREAENLRAIHSPYVIHLVDSFEENNVLYIETELCEGGSLDKLMKVYYYFYYLYCLYLLFHFIFKEKERRT